MSGRVHLASGALRRAFAAAGAIALSCALGPHPIHLAAALRGAQPDRAILLAELGATLQALLRNPLAEPLVPGVSGGAALGGTAILLAAGALALWFANSRSHDLTGTYSGTRLPRSSGPPCSLGCARSPPP